MREEIKRLASWEEFSIFKDEKFFFQAFENAKKNNPKDKYYGLILEDKNANYDDFILIEFDIIEESISKIFKMFYNIELISKTIFYENKEIFDKEKKINILRKFFSGEIRNIIYRIGVAKKTKIENRNFLYLEYRTEFS